MRPLPPPGELSHGTLIGVLMSMGGSYEMDTAYLESDAVATPDGFHAIEMIPTGPGRILLRVTPRPDVDDAGSAIRPRTDTPPEGL